MVLTMMTPIANFRPAFRNIFKILDYSKNLELPKFSVEKLGDTYNYSPLNVYQFGIYDVFTGKDVQH